MDFTASKFGEYVAAFGVAGIQGQVSHLAFPGKSH